MVNQNAMQVDDPRFLLVRLGSLGDIIHALPAAAALRDTFPGARIDWVVEPKWARLLEGNPDVNEVISLDRKSAGGILSTVRKLRAAKYTCAAPRSAWSERSCRGTCRSS